MDDIQKQNVLCYLEREREAWLPLHTRAERAGGYNAEANLAEAEAMKRIDPLLEELHKLGSVALEGAEHGASHL